MWTVCCRARALSRSLPCAMTWSCKRHRVTIQAAKLGGVRVSAGLYPTTQGGVGLAARLRALRVGDWSSLTRALLAAGGYYAGAKVGLELTFSPHPISVLWPPNSIL